MNFMSLVNFRVFILIFIFGLAESFNYATIPKKYNWSTYRGLAISMSGFLDHRIDISPKRDGSILKETLKTGNPNKDVPRANDEVQIDWKIYHKNGTLAHSSLTLEQSLRKEREKRVEPATTRFIFTDAETGEDIETVTTEQPGEEEPFTFRIGVEPREVILGWEYGIKTMREGEMASFEIAPKMAFGSAGVPGIVDPDETILCELTLLAIVPDPLLNYKTVQEGESITDELMEKIQKGETPIAEEAMDRSPAVPNAMDSRTALPPEVKGGGADDETEKKRRWFDPSRHQVDPTSRITGQGHDHSWEETTSTIDIWIPVLSGGRGVRKSDLAIIIRHDRVSVAFLSGEVLLEGMLFGRVVTDECMWALSADESGSIKGPHVHLSLEKAPGYREIWASALAIEPSPNADDIDRGLN